MSVPIHVHISRVRPRGMEPLLVAGIRDHIVHVALTDDDEALRADVLRRHPKGVFKRGSAATQEAARQVKRYLEGGPDPQMELVIPEGGFMSRVWRYLPRIPRGRVRTYGAVAKALRKPGAARAVGQACGRNPLPLFLPCHRVVAAGLKLGGFGGGLAMKQRLLELEGVKL